MNYFICFKSIWLKTKIWYGSRHLYFNVLCNVPALAPMALPATRQPSTSLCGSCRIISLSLHVPGSPSSALTTRYLGLETTSQFIGFLHSRRFIQCRSKYYNETTDVFWTTRTEIIWSLTKFWRGSNANLAKSVTWYNRSLQTVSVNMT